MTGKRCGIQTYTHNTGILLGHNKQWNSAICNKVYGAWKYYAWWNNAVKDKCCMLSLTCGI